jgi:hypothetical protein
VVNRAAIKRLLFLSRDRGSVQAIVPVIRELRRTGRADVRVMSLAPSRPLLEECGIASEPFDEAWFARAPIDCLDGLLAASDADGVVCGSSPARGIPPETPEQFLTMRARVQGIPSLSVLDFWGMYAERFISGGALAEPALVPDRICVMDVRSRNDLVTLGVPPDRIVVTHNPWLDDIVRRADALAATPGGASASSALTAIFASQPLAETREIRLWPYTQESLLNDFIATLPAAAGEKHRVIVWPHPGERDGRWAGLQAAQRDNVEVTVGRERDAEVLGRADLLVTSHSTLTYEALHYGTPCVSLRPGGGCANPLVIEELGLAPCFGDVESLKSYLSAFDPASARRALGQQRRELRRRGLFFSDGHATERVLDEVLTLVGAHASC